MKINLINTITAFLVADCIAILVYFGNDIRYDFYIIVSCVLVAVVSFAAGWFERKRRYPRKH